MHTLFDMCHLYWMWYNHRLLGINVYSPTSWRGSWRFLALTGWNQLKRSSLWLVWLTADFHGCLQFFMFFCKHSLTASRAAVQLKNSKWKWKRFAFKVQLVLQSCSQHVSKGATSTLNQMDSVSGLCCTFRSFTPARRAAGRCLQFHRFKWPHSPLGEYTFSHSNPPVARECGSQTGL